LKIENITRRTGAGIRELSRNSSGDNKKELFHEAFNAMSISLPTENWGQDRASVQARFDLDSDFWIIAPFRRPPGAFQRCSMLRAGACQGWPRLRGHPKGLAFDRSEHGGMLDRIGAAGDRHIIGKFKPVALGQIHAADNRSFSLP
jgi:hypothetical protein